MPVERSSIKDIRSDIMKKLADTNNFEKDLEKKINLQDSYKILEKR